MCLGLDTRVGVRIDASGVVNIFSGCFPVIFSQPPTFLSPAMFVISSVVKFDKLDIMLTENLDEWGFLL